MFLPGDGAWHAGSTVLGRCLGQEGLDRVDAGERVPVVLEDRLGGEATPEGFGVMFGREVCGNGLDRKSVV